MRNRRLLKGAIVAVLAAVSLAGCGSDNDNVPKAYQGTYQNQYGVTLVLTGSSAQLQIEGKILSGKVAPLDFDKLSKGQSGYYIYQETKNDTLMDVYWITPDVASEKSEGGIIYYTTDIVYMQIDLSQKSQVPSVTIVHADQGTVMLDTQTKRWEAGWPAQATEDSLVRVAGK